MREPGKRDDFGTELGLGGLLKGIGSLVELVSKMADEGTEEYVRSGEVKDITGKVRGVYGFNIRMGLGGKPVIQQFGNIRETETGPEVTDTREPLVDILDEADELMVIVELPGVEEEDIHVKVEGDILEVAASTGGKEYYKEVLLPSAVDEGKMQSHYRNGILEIRLAKR